MLSHNKLSSKCNEFSYTKYAADIGPSSFNHFKSSRGRGESEITVVLFESILLPMPLQLMKSKFFSDCK